MVQEKMCGEYLRKQEQLYLKKDKLFEDGKVASWDLMLEDLKGIGDPSKLKTDKALAMQLILPKVLLFDIV